MLPFPRSQSHHFSFYVHMHTDAYIDFAIYFFGVCMDVRIMRFTRMKLVAFTDKIKAKPTIEMVQNLVVKLYCSDDALREVLRKRYTKGS